ncbi:hypothetical protein RHSIM_RhsimUnG0058700 [Rhododendron simsii]|uniref:Uncharacterized protein n=1 Tax=Rhododendron simsii TaxID=118357 RepID=A0A834L5F5_RHOSS|nr:hypothetical protein RHSIM_RhsimUnG0058700 [Rhododendron simsii]
MMKEILLCSANFKNSLSDRRVLLYLNDCECGRKYCRENAAYLVKNQFKKVGMNELDGIDVYNFLHMARTSSKQEETTSACLGAEIDYLELEFDIAEWAMSPEQSSDKPIFEDIYEFQDDLENQMVDVGRPGALVAMSWWMIGGLPCIGIALFDEL